MAAEKKQKAKNRNIGRSRVLKRLLFNKKAIAGGILLLIIALSAIFAPSLTPHSPIDQSMMNRLEPPSSEHLLGTDNYGRDIFTRILYGGRLSLSIGFISVGIAVLVGCTLGIMAGFYGGKIDNVIMRFIDIMLALPGILLALAIIAALGASLNNLMIAVGISYIPVFARLMRSSVLSVIEKDYIAAARGIGGNDLHIIFKHVIPNSINPIVVQATLAMAGSILSAAGLSFLGLGAQPPTPEWGSMIASTRQFIRISHYPVTFSGLAIVITVLSLNLFGDGLRDALDPKTLEHN
ncbi:MAG: ABC transporter permease [Halanaerobiaceae bacterium]